jgi:hypothetical protein
VVKPAGDIRFVIAAVPGYANKGDRVEVVKTAGDLSLIKIGMKKIAVKTETLSICRALQLREVAT